MLPKSFRSLAIAMTALLLTLYAAGQERVLHSFVGTDGYQPNGPITFDGAGHLYGVAGSGGDQSCIPSGCGTVYELKRQTGGNWAIKILHKFINDGHDGFIPGGPLVFDSSGNIYGTTASGGSGTCTGPFGVGCGTVYQLSPAANGTWTENILYSFQNNQADGITPGAGVVLDAAGNLYGTTSAGGFFSNSGTIFKLAHNGDGTWSESVLHSFGQNNDGVEPSGGLTWDSLGNLYGVTVFGGNAGLGTVYELSPGTGSNWTEEVLHTFSSSFQDGHEPEGKVAFDTAGNLYGTTSLGGRHGYGAVYQLTPSGNGTWTEAVLYTFNLGAGGSDPRAGLIIDNAGDLFGTTVIGGTGACNANSGCGTVFELVPGGGGTWSESVLYSFLANRKDGTIPQQSLTFDAAGNLYGTTDLGGTSSACNTLGQPGCGTVFEVRLAK